MLMNRFLFFDEDGFYIKDAIDLSTLQEGWQFKEVGLNEEIAFHRPRLIDGELVEGKTEDEFYMDELISSLLPDAKELEKAEFEIKILTLLSEMEVI